MQRVWKIFQNERKYKETYQIESPFSSQRKASVYRKQHGSPQDNELLDLPGRTSILRPTPYTLWQSHEVEYSY